MCWSSLCEMTYSPLSVSPVLFSSKPPVQIDSFIEHCLVVLINFGSVFVFGKASLASPRRIYVCVCASGGWRFGGKAGFIYSHTADKSRVEIKCVSALWIPTGLCFGLTTVYSNRVHCQRRGNTHVYTFSQCSQKQVSENCCGFDYQAMF